MPGLALTTTSLALLAALLQQLIHESTHGLTTLAFGGVWEELNFFYMRGEPGTPGPWPVIVTKGGAAIVNIVIALAGVALYRRPALVLRPTLRLFVLYSTAYHALTGFGYLLFDPIFAKEGSLGDWANIVMLFGGGWEVRIPIMLVGAVGTVAFFFWIGRAALRLTRGDYRDRATRVRGGLVTLLVPYLAVNVVFSVLALFHTLGAGGTVMALIKMWFGTIGLMWGYLICFVWSPDKGPYGDETALPERVPVVWVVATLVLLAVSAVFLVPGIWFVTVPV